MAKRYHDWYKMQKDAQGWQNIPPDLALANRLMDLDITINVDHCHYGLANLLHTKTVPHGAAADFYIITDIEISKWPMSKLFDLYHRCYDSSRMGIYVAALSYYLNPERTDAGLVGSLRANIDWVFRDRLPRATMIENWSTVKDDPIGEARIAHYLEEGANYLFVHPNIRYLLWKTPPQ